MAKAGLTKWLGGLETVPCSLGAPSAKEKEPMFSYLPNRGTEDETQTGPGVRTVEELMEQLESDGIKYGRRDQRKRGPL